MEAGQLRPKTLTHHLSLLVKTLNDAVEARRLVTNRLHRSRAIRRPKPLREGDETVIEVREPAGINRLLDAVPIAQWESILYVSRQLGHSSVKITADIYGHLFPDERRTAAGRFEQRLGAARPVLGAPHGHVAPMSQDETQMVWHRLPGFSAPSGNPASRRKNPGRRENTRDDCEHPYPAFCREIVKALAKR